jgi:hypothetical protein
MCLQVRRQQHQQQRFNMQQRWQPFFRQTAETGSSPAQAAQG